MQDKFVVSFNFQVGKDFGFHFTEQDKAIEFEKSYVNCAQVTNQKFQDDWKIVLRKKSLHEILLTEESYIDSLQLLVNVCFCVY